MAQDVQTGPAEIWLSWTSHFLHFLQKSDEKSAKYRTAGNSMFSRHKLREATRLYTEAVLWASPASVDLSMAFANRSAAHFDNACYQASIEAGPGPGRQID